MAPLNFPSAIANYTEIMYFLPTEKAKHIHTLLFPCLATYISVIAPDSLYCRRSSWGEKKKKKSNLSFTEFLSIMICSNTFPVL